MKKNKLKELQDKLNLSKKFYINKTIFRVAMGLILLYLLIGVYLYGYEPYISVDCESKQCVNPFIYCEENLYKGNCWEWNKIECEGVNCDKYYISEGEYFGEKPPVYLKYGKLIIFFIILSAFVVNYIEGRLKND